MSRKVRKKAERKPGFRGPSPDVGKATQFRAGNNANPGGRPRTAILSRAIRERLGDVDPKDKQGRTFAEIIADRVVSRAACSDVEAARFLADRAEGKPIQVTVDAGALTREEHLQSIYAALNELADFEKKECKPTGKPN